MFKYVHMQFMCIYIYKYINIVINITHILDYYYHELSFFYSVILCLVSLLFDFLVDSNFCQQKSRCNHSEKTKRMKMSKPVLMMSYC